MNRGIYTVREEQYQISLYADYLTEYDDADGVDFEVGDQDGNRWSGTAMTVDEIGRILKRWSKSGEFASGAYFYCSDLFIVGRCGFDGIISAIRAAILNGDTQVVFVPLEDFGPD